MNKLKSSLSKKLLSYFIFKRIKMNEYKTVQIEFLYEL